MPRTIVVTGASSGVGLAAAIAFAELGDEVAVVGRNPQRLADAMARVRAAATGPAPAGFQADFEVLADVRRLAGELAAAYPAVDVLANNAGAIVADYRRTVDGFEATLQGNHLAPFLLTGLLKDKLAGGRVVNTASNAHRREDLDPDDLTGSAETYNSWRAYGSSKAANIIFAAEAAKRWPEIFSVSFHPGVVRTNFGVGSATKLFYKYTPFLVTPEKAGDLLVWLATARPGELADGGYYVGRKLTRPSRTAGDPAMADRLWEASAKAVGL
jgi:daunorubicin C-13 ketoreductase